MSDGEQRHMTPEELHSRINDVPEEITTTLGMMKTTYLDRKVIEFEDDNELTYAIEYRLKSDPDGRIVHRSVHVQLKRNVIAEGVTQPMG